MVKPQLVEGFENRKALIYSYSVDEPKPFWFHATLLIISGPDYEECPVYIHFYNGSTDEHHRCWFDNRYVADAHIRATFERLLQQEAQR